MASSNISLSSKRSLANQRLHRRQEKIDPQIQQKKSQEKEEPNFPCALCSQHFTSELLLKQHILQTHKRKRFRCTTCSFSTHYKHSLKQHDANKHQPEYKQHRCRYCGASFARQFDLQRHENIHTGEFPFTCPHCEKGYNKEAHLKRHVLTHKKKSTDVCVRKKQRGISFKCNKCTEVFAQNAKLKEHQAKKHPTAPEKFPCDQCDFATNHRNSLWRHRQHKHLHNLMKKFLCDGCGKGFRDRSHLQTHLGVHTKEKPFICHDCHRSFTRKGNLLSHIRNVHMKIKPFICGDCGKTFATKEQLSIHEESKNREKVVCGRCGLLLANKASLQTHLRMMHGSEPLYKCRFCPCGLTNKGNLKRHEENHLAKPILID